MRPIEKPELLDNLENPAPVEPPPGLASRIKAEIPELASLGFATEPRSEGRGYKWRRIAAAFLMVAGGVVLTSRLQQYPVEVPPAAIEKPAEEPDLQPECQIEMPGEVGLEAVEKPVEPKAESVPAADSSAAGSEALELEVMSRRVASLPEDSSSQRSGLTADIGGEKRLSPGSALSSSAPLAKNTTANRALAGKSGGRSVETPASRSPETILPSSARSEYRMRRLAEPEDPAPIAESREIRADGIFRRQEASPFLDPEDDAQSTFGLDVDTGSYAVARRYLTDGRLPPRDSVRIEEWINAFEYRDRAPEEEDFALVGEGAPAPYASGERYYVVRFALKGREIAATDRRPALLTFLVDTSGSMARPGRLEWVKQALDGLLVNLRREDRVALVAYGTRGRVMMEPTGDKERLREAIDRLQTEGSTHMEDGLSLAYDLTRRFRRPHETSRIILCSDGLANVGQTTAEGILERVRSEADRGIELSTVGFGLGTFNDELMERLADTGDGRYTYVDSLDQAHRIFVERLDGILETIAFDARAQVEWNPETVALYRLLGYENREISDDRFRDDSVDGGEVGAGHTVTALYEVKLERPVSGSEHLATLRLRYRPPGKGQQSVELLRELRGSDLVESWEAATPALRLAALVAELGEVLEQTYWARDGDLDDVFRRLQRLATAEFPGDREVAELVSLAGKAAAFRKRQTDR